MRERVGGGYGQGCLRVPVGVFWGDWTMPRGLMGRSDAWLCEDVPCVGLVGGWGVDRGG